MLRVLVAVCLCVVAWAPAAPGSSASPCGASQLRLSVETQGESTTTWIGVRIRDLGRACVVSGAVELTVERAERPAAIEGNPLRLALTGSIGRGGSRLVRADWANWCGPRRGLSLRARYRGLSVRSRPRHVPVCLGREAASRLVPVR